MVLGLAGSAAAQSPETRGPAAAEFTAGYAAFLDESAIGHSVFGASLRFPLWWRLSAGPEVAYMIGPGDDRDLMLTGNVTLDFLASGPGRTHRATPYVVAGFGVMNLSNRSGGVGYSSNEGAFTGGGGVRVWVTRKIYAAGEFRVGWEPHIRFTGTVGVALN